MSPKSIKITYWVVTALFVLFTIADAAGGITKQEAGIVVLKHLGYPIYLMPFLGVLKLAGAIAILLPNFKTLKEWAYAGFAFNFIGAFASRAIVGDGIGLLLMPLVVLAIMFASYFLWKKIEALRVS